MQSFFVDFLVWLLCFLGVALILQALVHYAVARITKRRRESDSTPQT